MKRTVILPVPEGADDYVVTFTGPDPGDPDGYKQFVDGKKPPLPADDQLTQALSRVCDAAEAHWHEMGIGEEDEIFDNAALVRAAAGLDNE